MNKFYGKVGFAIPTETAPGVWDDGFIEIKNYRGDLIRNTTGKWQADSDSTNDNLTIDNDISIVADAFAFLHFHCIKYVEYMGIKWKVTSVEIKRPRLILKLGGVYNE